jgi:hypothetical protein
MIPLARIRTDAINETFRGEQLVSTSLKLLQAQRAIKKGDLEKHNFNSGIWKKAKDQLLEETVDKCAYCEAPVAVVAYGDVEHYRPKSKYWWLAYCVDNYLASCAICNQRFKKDRFTFKNSKMRPPMVRSNTTDARLAILAQTLAPDPLDANAVSAFVALHRQERPFLVNPYVDKPEDFFAWQADINVGEVELIAQPGNPETAHYVETAVDIYGLNRSQLKRSRYFIFDSYYTHKKTLLDDRISAATRADNEQAIANMALPERAFAGMIRFFEAAGQPDDWEQCGFLIT